MTPDRDFIAAMQTGTPPIGTPDPIAADEAERETAEGLLAMPMTPDEEAEQVNLRG